MRNSHYSVEGVALLLLTCVMGLIMASAAVRAGDVTRADKLWPKPKALVDYEKALKLFEMGDFRSGLGLANKASQLPLRLASDYAWPKDASLYYGPYLNGRQGPALATMRKVWGEIHRQAAKLGASGKHADALCALLVDLQIAHQMIHIAPAQQVPLIDGNALWADTWESIAAELAHTSEKAKARRAAHMAEKAHTFSRTRIQAEVDRSSAELRKIGERLKRLSDKDRSKEERDTIGRCVNC